MRVNRTLSASFSLSLLLHLLGLFGFGLWWRDPLDEEVFRVRLKIPPRFEPQRLGAVRPQELPEQRMQYLVVNPQSELVDEVGLALTILPSDSATAPQPELAPVLEQVSPGSRQSRMELPRETLPSPTEFAYGDTVDSGEMDLLRYIDLARVNREHALVSPDPGSLRDIQGYLNITRLRVYGGGSDTAGAIDALARYLRDHTKMLVQVRDTRYDYFLSEHLLKDPIHFILQGGGLPAYDPERTTYFSQPEYEMLGTYLRGGGFLFVEGKNRFLVEMAAHLTRILGSDGRIFPLPPTHSMYHSFYNFPSGFPGEEKGKVPSVPQTTSWDYPRYNPREAAEQSRLERQDAFGSDSQEVEALPPPVGIWGVEFEGELVAIFSDLGLCTRWVGPVDPGTSESLPALQSATNIVIYALTKESGLTPKRQQPVWEQQRPSVAVSSDRAVVEELGGWELGSPDLAAHLYTVLDGSLALLRAPLGSDLGSGGMDLVVDGTYTVALLRSDCNGLLVHNLPAGRHWVELRYQGQINQIEVDLVGGQVTTVVFGVDRIAFFARLRLKAQQKHLPTQLWTENFADLHVQEIYVDEAEKTLLIGVDGG